MGVDWCIRWRNNGGLVNAATGQKSDVLIQIYEMMMMMMMTMRWMKWINKVFPLEKGKCIVLCIPKVFHCFKYC